MTNKITKNIIHQFQRILGFINGGEEKHKD